MELGNSLLVMITKDMGIRIEYPEHILRSIWFYHIPLHDYLLEKKCKQGTAHRLQKRETGPLSRIFSQFSIFLSSKMIIIIMTVTSNSRGYNIYIFPEQVYIIAYLLNSSPILVGRRETTIT